MNAIDGEGHHPKHQFDKMSSSAGEEYSDITEELNEMMITNALEIMCFRIKSLFITRKITQICNMRDCDYYFISYVATTAYFVNKVRPYGKWDIKRYDYKYNDHFIYNGEVYSGEDLGNIHFGFVGSTMYSPWFLHFGAGVVQILVGTKWKYWKTLFDEPRDSDMIDYGIELYENR